MTGIDSFSPCCRLTHNRAPSAGHLARRPRPSITPPDSKSRFQGSPMNRLHTTAAALLVFALAGSGCARNKHPPEPARAVAGDDDRRQRLSVARGARHGLLRAAAPGQPQQRRDHHRLVRQPEGAGRAGQAHRRDPRPGPARRCASRLRLAAGQPERRLGRRAGLRGDRAEARGHHPDPRPRPAPRRRSAAKRLRHEQPLQPG